MKHILAILIALALVGCDVSIGEVVDAIVSSTPVPVEDTADWQCPAESEALGSFFDLSPSAFDTAEFEGPLTVDAFGFSGVGRIGFEDCIDAPCGDYVVLDGQVEGEGFYRLFNLDTELVCSDGTFMGRAVSDAGSVIDVTGQFGFDPAAPSLQSYDPEEEITLLSAIVKTSLSTDEAETNLLREW